MSKGSRPRPFDVPRDQFRDNWDKIFGKNKQKPRPEPKEPQPS